ncbi:hypothetical protein JW710_02510 [Candidatus Dojkabacteria bacterium]|nr:hypothetical protein [Candidatus Dojkabacteria bacterium]
MESVKGNSKYRIIPYLRYIIIGGCAVGAVFFILFVVRLVGFIVGSRSYSYVEQIMDYVDEVNLLVDTEEGLTFKGCENVEKKASDNVEAVKNLESKWKNLNFAARQLSDNQEDVCNSAVEYLEAVQSVAEKCAEENDTWDDSKDLPQLYENYRDDVEKYEDEMNNYNKRFLLSL